MTEYKFGEATRARLQKMSEVISVKEGHIVINVEYEYNIPLDSCKTYEQILSWAMQLTEKTWMTTEVLRYFFDVALSVNKLDRPRA